ncbi:MAG: hypothetical protein KTR35_05310 [Gammaproteobacteria bacterium]|nr:hypothetical protein [Gammaproteobacteria bacterium]
MKKSASNNWVPARGNIPNRASKSAPTYLKLWESVKNLRQENQKRLSHLKDIANTFEAEIKPLEQKLMAEIFFQTKVLIDLYDKLQLESAERSLLGLWITDHQTSMGEHPFAQHLPLEELYIKWQSVLTSGNSPIDKHLASFSANSHKKSKAKNEARASTHNPSNESTASVKKDQKANHTKDEHLKESKGSSTQSASAYLKQDNAERLSERIDSAMESILSIDKLFRKLAHALHPDREQDETRKEHKDELMRQCLEARDRGDLTSMLVLYDTHIGGLPELKNEADVRNLEKLLQQEIKTLKLERSQLQSSGTLQAHILERYRSDSREETARRFSDHAQKLNQKIRAIKSETVELQTDNGLQKALLRRREVELDRLVIRELTGV